MKIDPLFLEKYIIATRLKVVDYLALISAEKLLRNKFKESKKSFPFISNISKTEKYQKIIERIKNFKIDSDLNDQSNKSKDSASLIKEIMSSNSYKTIISQINKFKNKKVKQKKSKKIIKDFL